MMAGPSWSSIRSVTTRSENAWRRILRSTADLGGLRFGGGMVVLERHRSGARVLGDLEPLARQLLAGLRQRKVIVVAGHALDFHQLLLPHVLEDDVYYRDGQFERITEGLQVAEPFEQ